jgi:hypothetical protein
MKNINEEIEVNSYYFSRGMRSFPRSITFGSRRYTFQDGLQYLIGQGSRSLRLFDMTDGTTTYRLRNEDDRWMLVGMKVA